MMSCTYTYVAHTHLFRSRSHPHIGLITHVSDDAHTHVAHTHSCFSHALRLLTDIHSTHTLMSLTHIHSTHTLMSLTHIHSTHTLMSLTHSLICTLMSLTLISLSLSP